jgi:hypothetical protein
LFLYQNSYQAVELWRMMTYKNVWTKWRTSVVTTAAMSCYSDLFEYTLCKVEGQLEGSKQQYNRYHVSSSFSNNIFIQQLVYISSGHSTHNANCYITLSSLKMCALGFYLAEMKWWFRSAPQSCEHVVPWCPSLRKNKKNVKEHSLN